MSRRGWVLAAAIAIGLAAAVAWFAAGRTPSVRIAGEGAPLPQADAESEFISVAALAAARTESRRLGVRAFIIHRHGHRVFAYPDQRDGARSVAGGELAAAVLQLALHPVEDAQAGATAVALRVSERIWLPLRAADAWLRTGPDDTMPRCCIEARVDDWMRVADLLNGHGAYLGERVVAADAIRALLAAHQAAVAGDEPLLARDGTAFDLAPDLRLWLVPRRGLTMLVWADAATARDTLLPNLVLRGLDDVSPAVDGDISGLVPGH